MHTQTVSLNGIELHYQIEGEGEPLLLLHGGTGCHEDWVHCGRDHFVREYKLIQPDARGHGRSTNPEKIITHRPCPWTPWRCSIIWALRGAAPSA
jgi:pimeloyl-ACP methyl ester carboxylesterase